MFYHFITSVDIEGFSQNVRVTIKKNGMPRHTMVSSQSRTKPRRSHSCVTCITSVHFPSMRLANDSHDTRAHARRLSKAFLLPAAALVNLARASLLACLPGGVDNAAPHPPPPPTLVHRSNAWSSPPEYCIVCTRTGNNAEYEFDSRTCRCFDGGWSAGAWQARDEFQTRCGSYQKHASLSLDQHRIIRGMHYGMPYMETMVAYRWTYFFEGKTSYLLKIF